MLFGATGFAGRLVAAYLAGHAQAGTRIGLAGRSPARLAEVRAGLGVMAAGWPLRTADCAPRRAGSRGCGQIPNGTDRAHPGVRVAAAAARSGGAGIRRPASAHGLLQNPAGCYGMRTILPSRWPCASRR